MNARHLIRLLLTAVAVCVLALGVVGSGAVQPELEVLSNNLTSEVIKTAANEDDWSYVYTVQVRNVGQAGKVRAKGRITTPQGQFYREMVVALDSDETKVLRFVYPEPNFIAELFTQESRSSYEFSYDVLR